LIRSDKEFVYSDEQLEHELIRRYRGIRIQWEAFLEFVRFEYFYLQLYRIDQPII